MALAEHAGVDETGLRAEAAQSVGVTAGTRLRRARSRFARDLSIQVIAAYASTFAQVVRGLILARLLGPDGLGTLATVALLLMYAQYADLGIQHAVSRQIPLTLGFGDEARARSYHLHGFAAKVATSGILGAVVATYVLLQWGHLDHALRFGLLTAAFVVVLQAVSALQVVAMQARQRFKRAGAVTLVIAVSSLITGVAGALIDGVRGVFIGQLIAYALASVLAVSLGGLPLSTGFTSKGWSELLRLGLPLALLAFVGYNLVNVDQLVILWLLDRSHLGLYTLVLYAGNALYLLPTGVAQVVGPRLLRRYGEHPRLSSISEFTWLPVDTLSAILPGLIVLGWVLGAVVIRQWLPQYTASIGPLRVYLTGMFFLCVNLGVSSTLLAMNRHQLNIPILIGVIGLNLAIDWVLVGVAHLGLLGVAWGSLVTYTTYCLTHLGLVRWFYERDVRRVLLKNLRVLWPGFLLVGVVACLSLQGRIATPDSRFDLALFGVMALIAAERLRRLSGRVRLRRQHT